MNIVPQKVVLQKVNASKAMTIRIYGKNLHNFLIDSGASCNVMPLSIA